MEKYNLDEFTFEDDSTLFGYNDRYSYSFIDFEYKNYKVSRDCLNGDVSYIHISKN